ncbi:hypothetical protein L227DRAFT_60625 [Lentinus tigrinus ALCF2SS1-6]|uniref:Uncharacterized protein n=1 Tax=Lentinus tigrinus ALCF2SS1-6 TaxID=1328759 RepID=A0A5C2SDI3_9APHY|nr:hypothetical protein L227DRAFT_60625 [Lentinus tigrinus ALCF2SS1-6]
MGIRDLINVTVSEPSLCELSRSVCHQPVGRPVHKWFALLLVIVLQYLVILKQHLELRDTRCRDSDVCSHSVRRLTSLPCLAVGQQQTWT